MVFLIALADRLSSGRGKVIVTVLAITFVDSGAVNTRDSAITLRATNKLAELPVDPGGPVYDTRPGTKAPALRWDSDVQILLRIICKPVALEYMFVQAAIALWSKCPRGRRRRNSPCTLLSPRRVGNL